MLFTLVVGIILHFLWPHFQHNTKDFVSLTLLINLSFVPIIIMQILASNLNIALTIFIVFCSICLSPISWLLIGLKLNIEFLYSTLFDFYSSLGITASLLLCQLAEEAYSNSHLVNNTPCKIQCSFCGNKLQDNQIFCNNCHHISHIIRNTFETFSHKICFDFVEVNSKHHKLCPHCNEILAPKKFSFGLYLGIPIRLCNGCQNVYLDSSVCEWFGLSILNKARLCLFDGTQLIFYVVFLSQAMNRNISSQTGIFVCLVVTLLRIIWFFTITTLDIQESEARLQANPEYPQILVNMGYEHFKENYIKISKHQ